MPHEVVGDRQRHRAKQLRQTMTRAETLLWRHVKAGRTEGLGFRRQVPIRNYIADFEERQKADQRRDAFFASEGFQVLRFTNEQVMSNLEGVVDAIRQATTSLASGLPPSPALPTRGEGAVRP